MNDIYQKSNRRALLVVVACLSMTFVAGAMVISCAGLFFTPVSSYFQVPTAQFTLYFSIVNVAQAVCMPIVGKLYDRVGIRKIASVSALVCAATFFLMSRATAVWQFYLFGALLGFSNTSLTYLAGPTLINRWFAKRRGLFVGLAMACTGIGGVVFNPITNALIATGPEGWRLGYLLFAVLVLVITFPLVTLFVRDSPQGMGLLPYGASRADDAAGLAAAGEDGAAGESGSEAAGMASAAARLHLEGIPARDAVRTPVFAVICVYGFLVGLNLVVYQFFASYCSSFQATLPGIAALAGTVAASCMAGQAIGKVVLGSVNDKSGLAGHLMAMVFGIVGVLLMWLFPQVPALLLSGAFLFGFVYSCSTVQLPMFVRQSFGSLDYTSLNSKAMTFGPVGAIIGSVFWAWVIELPGGFSLMFVLSLVCMALALVAGLYVSLSRGKLEARFVKPE